MYKMTRLEGVAVTGVAVTGSAIRKVMVSSSTQFCKMLKASACRVGLQFPKVEVRFEHLSLEADVFVGNRSLPSLPNSILNVVEVNPHVLLAHQLLLDSLRRRLSVPQLLCLFSNI